MSETYQPVGLNLSKGSATVLVCKGKVRKLGVRVHFLSFIPEAKHYKVGKKKLDAVLHLQHISDMKTAAVHRKTRITKA
jgi:hypothetical protein